MSYAVALFHLQRDSPPIMQEINNLLSSVDWDKLQSHVFGKSRFQELLESLAQAEMAKARAAAFRREAPGSRGRSGRGRGEKCGGCRPTITYSPDTAPVLHTIIQRSPPQFSKSEEDYLKEMSEVSAALEKMCGEDKLPSNARQPFTEDDVSRFSSARMDIITSLFHE